MASLKIQTNVPAQRERVYRYITGVGPTGVSNRRTFAARHGQIQEHFKDGFVTTQGRGDDTVIWRCTFHYPDARYMESLDGSWSDRIDIFDDNGDGTLWTIKFHTKTSGLKVITQWVFFHLISKKRIHSQVVRPVLEHFL